MKTGEIIALSIAAVILIGSVLLIIFAVRRDENKEMENHDRGAHFHNMMTIKSGYMSPKELQFLVALQKAADKMSLLVFPKVAVRNIIGSKDTKHAHNLAFSYTVDFCLFTKNDYTPVLVVDLYDNTIGDQSLFLNDPIVERIIKSAGLPILALEVQSDYKTDDLQHHVEGALNNAVKNALTRKN